MAGAARLGDKAQIQQDSHGCPGCPHPGVGPAISGSADVLINGLPAVRLDDVGIQAVCCGPNMWSAAKGSVTVFINGKPAVRNSDETRHCGGSGKMVEGSDNVIIGGASGTGNGSGGGPAGSSAASQSAGGGGSAGAGASGTSPANAGAAPSTVAPSPVAVIQAAAPAQSQPDPIVFSARWEKSSVRFGASIRLIASCANAAGQPATFTILAADAMTSAPLLILSTSCAADHVETTWTTPAGPTPDRVVFEVAVGSQRADSGELSFLVAVEGTVQVGGKPAADLALILTSDRGGELRGKTDGQGHFRIEDVPSGSFTVRPDDGFIARVEKV